MTTLRRVRARRGLTLMELIIVILILVALAGILIPIFPSLLTKAHTSTGVTTAGELTKAVQMHESTYFGYPDYCDSLVGDGTTELFTKLPGGLNANSTLLPYTLTAPDLAALNAAGIAHVWDMDNATTAPTFNPYPAAPRVLAVGGQIAVLDAAGINALNLNPNGAPAERFAVLGVGKNCTMVGRSITDPPVHFSDSPTEAPDKVYVRSILVFRLTKNGGTTPLNRAVFVAAAEIMGEGVSGKDGHLQEYYDTVNNNNN